MLDEARSFVHKSAPRPLFAVCPHAGFAKALKPFALGVEIPMPKMKTNRAAAKRFKVTGSGRVRRPKGNAQHGMIGKSRKRRRRLRDNDMVDSAMEHRVKIMLPYG